MISDAPYLSATPPLPPMSPGHSIWGVRCRWVPSPMLPAHLATLSPVTMGDVTRHDRHIKGLWLVNRAASHWSIMVTSVWWCSSGPGSLWSPSSGGNCSSSQDKVSCYIIQLLTLNLHPFIRIDYMVLFFSSLIKVLIGSSCYVSLIN